ncbi:MAG: protein TolA, partial [Hyphomicrobium sp.]
MPFGLIISLICHAALLFWAIFSMRAVQQLPVEDTPAISAAIVTPSEFLRLKQGAEDSKKLETKAKDEPKPDDSKNETKKPDN